MEIFAEIKGIKYTPLLCRELETYSITSLGKAIEEKSSFIIEINEKDRVAVSWWVSPKRTRSYPYARVYDTLGFSGKKITIIPIIKDEGKDGDRDFLQWDTISLMSLLGIYVIVSYYVEAEKSGKYDNKITKQRFDIEQLKKRDNQNFILSIRCTSLESGANRKDTKDSRISLYALRKYF